MNTKLKPADSKARAMLEKLQALAERGVDGEKAVAQRKLLRLKARFDFSAPDPNETPDLFSGSFHSSRNAVHVFSFKSDEIDIANSVKWAIERATHIPCFFRNEDLLAEATIKTSKRLTEIATHIALSFRALIKQFGAIDGVNMKDRGVFIMGLYDGMMNETRADGQRLPSRMERVRKNKMKKTIGPDQKPILNIHPYSIGLSLGKQIRFSASIEQISAELDAITRKHLA
jgi:hypothetical protein